MRVLLVNSHGGDPAYGGAERYVRDLAFGLRARGHEPLILSAFPPVREIDCETHVLHRSDWRTSGSRRLRNHAGDIISLPSSRLTEALSRLRPQLIHTGNLPGIGSGIWKAAQDLRIPVVHTLHDYHLLCPRTTLMRRDGRACVPSPLLCGMRTRRLARWTGAVAGLIAGSQHLLDVHHGLFRAGERVIRLPIAPVGDSAASPPGIVPKTIGYLGALTPAKGVEVLLEAMPALAGHGIELRIAGDGPLRQRVAATDAYAGRVEGPAKEEFLLRCDLGIVPSLWDEPSGPPYVVCEWLAAGRPVLVTARGGLLEAARTGGVLPFEASPEGLVDATLRLRDDDTWRRSVAAVPEVNDDMDVQRWLDEHEEAYQRAAMGLADDVLA